MSFLVWRMMILVDRGRRARSASARWRSACRSAAGCIDLVVICVLASLSFSALGLLIACRARTIEAVSGLMNLVQVPMWILSGVFFSAQRFPDAVQPLIQALPLTAVIDALRAHMLQGATPRAAGAAARAR